MLILMMNFFLPGMHVPSLKWHRRWWSYLNVTLQSLLCKCPFQHSAPAVCARPPCPAGTRVQQHFCFTEIAKQAGTPWSNDATGTRCNLCFQILARSLSQHQHGRLGPLGQPCAKFAGMLWILLSPSPDLSHFKAYIWPFLSLSLPL